MRIQFQPQKAEPAIGMIETESIARGLLVADGIFKEAPVEMLLSSPTSPGYYFNLFTGDVEEVRSSLERGILLAGAGLRDHLLLPRVHRQVLEALFHIRPVGEDLEAIGILESRKMASLLVGADMAAKAAEVQMVHIHLAVGIGGNSFAIFVGPYDEVETSLKEGAGFLADKGALKEEVLIGQADPEMAKILLQSKLPERNSI